MVDTKEKILLTALHLFARDGYEAVSVSSIAGALGMTKGALYKHYKNKRDIFDCIVQRMIQIDASRAQQYAVPAESYAANASGYQGLSWDSIREFTLAQLLFWTRDDFACSFRRMLSLEQYRSTEMAELYHSCLVSGPVAYMEDIFLEMHREGLLAGEPKQLAMAYYAPLYLLISMADHTGDSSSYQLLLEQHIECFIRQNTAALSGGTESCL